MTVHVIGAGVAGLACAVDLVRRGAAPVVHEAAGHGGGRCRSFFDTRLERVIDNGSHLLLAGNWAVRRYLEIVGGADQVYCAASAEFPFVDVSSGERWCLRPNPGRLPWWLLVPSRRVPGTAPADYLAAFRLRKAAGRTFDQVFPTGTAAWRRFWEPLAIAVLNAAAEEADAGLLWPVMRETFLAGEAACRPVIAKAGLSAALIEPGLAWLAANGAGLRFSHRLKTIEQRDGRAAALVFEDDTIALGPQDRVVLAVPPVAAAELLPGLSTPDAFRAIVNAHYRLDRAVAPPGRPALLGVVGGAVQWLFLRDDIVSATVSAADLLAERPNEDVAALLWDDVRRALSLGGGPPPPWRIMKERRATFAQTPAQLRRRPPAETRLANLFLAGDWTDTGLPATIEGAMRSGREAARLAA